MYYSLNDNVYIVEGTAKGCLYDLNHGKLYSVNKALSAQLAEINKNGLPTDGVGDELENVLRHFVEKQLIKIAPTHVSNCMEDIKNAENGCQFAWIEITNKCNLKCIHCYNESDSQCDTTMSLADFCHVADYLLKTGVSKIQITGGEPFLQKDVLNPMLDYVVNKFSFIEIFTNGTLITDEWFDYLSKNSIRIALSVHSYLPDQHDAVTQVAGAYRKTYHTIEKLKKFNIPYRVCNVRMKGIDLGEKNTDLFTLSEDRDIVRVTGRADFSLLSDELIKKRLITKESFQAPITKSFCTRLISGHNCFHDKIYISADLDVFPCVMERRIKHGTLKRDDFQLNHHIRNFTKDNIKECSECEYRYACFDCRPNSLHGELNEKPWYCTYEPHTGHWQNADEFIFHLKHQ